MVTLFVVLLSLIVLFILVYQGLSALNRSQIKQTQLIGIKLLKQISELIVNSQKHRGISITYVKGNNGAITEIKRLQLNISNISSQLEVNEAQLVSSERWLAYQTHWQKLSVNIADLSAENIFQQHTRLVANLLFLLEDIAEQYRLSSQYLKSLPIADLLWRELLQVVECIGQSRALGTGAATAKICSSVEKIQLGFLRNKISTVANVIFAELTGYSEKINDRELAGLIKRSSEHTESLCLIIEQQLLLAKQVDLDADEYFELATQTMGSINGIFANQLNRLEQLIN